MVDLPAPLGPSRPKISPWRMRKEIWSAAVKSPNRLVRPSASTIADASRPRDVGAAEPGERGFTLLGRAADQIDEGVLETRRRGLYGCGGRTELARTRGLRSLGEQQAHAAALDDAVEDLGPRQRREPAGAVGRRRAGHEKGAAVRGGRSALCGGPS